MKTASRLEAMPRILIIDSPVTNAFAAGRNPRNPVVAATKGLHKVCNREEPQAAIGHGLAHIKHRDTLFMTLLAVDARAYLIILAIGIFLI